MNTTEIFPHSLDTMSEKEVGTTISNIIIGTENAPVKESVIKTTRQRRITDSVSAKVSPSDYLKILQEKMDIVRLLDAVEMPEIPTALTKANRDIMIEFQKEHTGLIAKYMEKIQKA